MTPNDTLLYSQINALLCPLPSELREPQGQGHRGGMEDTKEARLSNPS